MSRSIGSASISFGLVTIPVKLYTAAEAAASVSFNMLHEKCGTRVRQQLVCQHCSQGNIDRAETVKGYEFAKDRYVTFTADELKALEEPATKSLTIEEFVDAEQVDPLFMDGAVYYLLPDGSEPAYATLMQAMIGRSAVGIGKWAARGHKAA